MAQTAVEWLIEQINHYSWNNVMIDIPKDVIEQSKQMEKEQHYNTWLTAQMNCQDDDYIGIAETFEKYYNETYGKQ